MFTSYHIAWLIISAVLIVAGVLFLRKRKPPLKDVLSFACVMCVLSELVKTFSVIKLVPSADGSAVYPYLELQHLPFHLCSIQIIFIFYSRFAKDSERKTTLLAFMYPSCLIGALCALALPSIFSTSISPSQAFTHPLAYQFFLFHTMLVVLGSYIAMSGQVNIRSKHYLSSLIILAVLGFVSIYLNSMFASPIYENGVLKSVEYVSNFFFTYRPPIAISLTEPWHWYLYLGVLAVLAIVLLALMYLPFYLRERREQALKS